MKGTENCWEFKQCGREPGGAMAETLGVCPVAVATFANGLNRGMNGGRICWAMDGGCDREKGLCVSCEFFNLLKEEEVKHHIPATDAV